MPTMSEPTDYRGMSCDEFANMAAELALGVLTGRERAAALAHLDGCESCRELVRELTMTGEELLALLPSREPPPGFETRVLERIGQAAPGQSAPGQAAPSRPQPVHRQRADHRADRDTGRPAAGRPPARPRSRMRRALSAAAVVVALVVAGLGGWGLRSATAPSTASPPAASSVLSTAALVTTAHQTVGMVTVYKHTPWMYMSVNLDGLGNVTVKCQLENAAGQFTQVGQFRLAGGYGSWASTFPSHGAVVGARLLSTSNAVLATATFHN
jgi:Putative zinc-finger